MKSLCMGVVAASIAIASSAQAARTSDLRDYAVASCLIKQTASKELQTEGYHLADIVINRAGIDPFAWKSLQDAADAELARQGLVMIHVDGPVAQATQPAPLATCLHIADAPLVRAAIAKLVSGKKRSS